MRFAVERRRVQQFRSGTATLRMGAGRRPTQSNIPTFGYQPHIKKIPPTRDYLPRLDVIQTATRGRLRMLDRLASGCRPLTLPNVRFRLRIQPVDATHWPKRSAGILKSKV